IGANTAGAQPQGLEIVGAGTGLTFVRSTVSGQAALRLTGPGESVTGLTVRLTAQSGANPPGLLLEKGARADGIRATADAGISGVPIRIDSGGQLSHAVVDGDAGKGVVVTDYVTPNETTIADSDIRGAWPIQVWSTGITRVARDRVTVSKAAYPGVLGIDGETIVRDTLIDLRSAPSSTG